MPTPQNAQACAIKQSIVFLWVPYRSSRFHATANIRCTLQYILNQRKFWRNRIYVCIYIYTVIIYYGVLCRSIHGWWSGGCRGINDMCVFSQMVSYKQSMMQPTYHQCRMLVLENPNMGSRRDYWLLHTIAKNPCNAWWMGILSKML